jgi:hypothetical protein
MRRESEGGISTGSEIGGGGGDSGTKGGGSMVTGSRSEMTSENLLNWYVKAYFYVPILIGPS